MKALAVIFGKRCFKIVLKEWIDSSEKFLSQLLNFTSYCWYVYSILFQLFPYNFKTSFASLAECLGTAFEIGMVFIEVIVGQMDVGIAEILFCWLLVVFSAKSS